MGRYSKYDHYWPEYVSVSERKAKAEMQLKKLMAKSETKKLNPVTINGRNISSSWWGNAWCENLESYADYYSRIGRGKSYVRNGMVLDLKISKGKIEAIVAGSRPNPYTCTIDVTPITPATWENIKEHLGTKFDSIQILLSGLFPEALKHIFSSKEFGFFPSPKEIKMDCSCPDWASLCKHLAAVFYAVGARLDKNPELIFTLRGADIKELTSEAIKTHKKSLLKKAANAKKSKKIIDNTDDTISTMFGIDISDNEWVDLIKASKKGQKKNRSAKKKLKKKLSSTSVRKKKPKIHSTAKSHAKLNKKINPNKKIN